jgi:hypothetical protein
MIKKSSVNKNIFKITDLDGKKYSSYSRDFNKVHLDDKVGYNSIYGEKICHGCFVFIKSLKIIIKNFKIEKFNYISINFINHFAYNKIIYVKKIKNFFYLIQQNKIKAKIEINIRKKIDPIINLKNYKYFKIKKNNIKSKKKLLTKLIGIISHHVGMINPGENSIINSIKISSIKNKLNFENGIYSKIIKNGYPIINNFLIDNYFFFEFETAIRPFLFQKKSKAKKKIIYLSKNFNSNILILGASQGIGLELFNILKLNTRNVIIATYNKNKIKIQNRKFKTFKIDIFKDINKVIKIIQIYNINTVYYFCTTKISLKCNKEEEKIYKKIYIEIPIYLIKKVCKDRKINFFYPSTEFINTQQMDTCYAKIKLLAERKLNSIKNNNLSLSIARLPKINTKQNLNLFNIRHPNLIDTLNKNYKICNKFFFVNFR